MNKNRRDAAAIEFIIIMLISDMIIFIGGDFFTDISVAFDMISMPLFFLWLNFYGIYSFVINLSYAFYFYPLLEDTIYTVLSYYVVFIVIVNLVSLLGITDVIRRMMSTKLLIENNTKPSIITRLIRTNIKWTMLYFWPVVAIVGAITFKNPYYNKKIDKTPWDNITKTKVVPIDYEDNTLDKRDNAGLEKSLNSTNIHTLIWMIIATEIVIYAISNTVLANLHQFIVGTTSIADCIMMLTSLLVSFTVGFFRDIENSVFMVGMTILTAFNYSVQLISITIPLSYFGFMDMVYGSNNLIVVSLDGSTPSKKTIVKRNLIKWSMLIYSPLIRIVDRLLGGNLFIDEDTGLTYWDKQSGTRVVEIEE